MGSVGTGWKVLAGLGIAGAGLVILRFCVRRVVYKGKTLLVGKTIIVTGANSGIGLETARELARRKGRIILACKDTAKGEEAIKNIRKSTSDGELVVRHLDLASFKSIRQFSKEVCKEESRIDVLINNAGVFQCPYSQTEDGFEMQMGVNHLGHFLLTNLLLDKLKVLPQSRVVVVTSGLHKRGHIDFDNLNSERNYDKKAAYNNSKLANNLFAQELARRVEGSGVSVYCLHPGMCSTNLGRHVLAGMSAITKLLLAPFFLMLVKTAWEGCQTVVYCAVDESLKGVSGRYYGDCKEEQWTDVSCDKLLAENLWDVSARLTQLKTPS